MENQAKSLPRTKRTTKQDIFSISPTLVEVKGTGFIQANRTVKVTRRMVPGIPKYPAVRAVIGFIGSLMPNGDPRRLIHQRISAPMITLTATLAAIFSGLKNVRPTKKMIKKVNPVAKAMFR